LFTVDQPDMPFLAQDGFIQQILKHADTVKIKGKSCNDIKFVLGASGSGKTCVIYEVVKRIAANRWNIFPIAVTLNSSTQIDSEKESWLVENHPKLVVFVRVLWYLLCCSNFKVSFNEFIDKLVSYSSMAELFSMEKILIFSKIILAEK